MSSYSASSTSPRPGSASRSGSSHSHGGASTRVQHLDDDTDSRLSQSRAAVADQSHLETEGSRGSSQAAASQLATHSASDGRNSSSQPSASALTMRQLIESDPPSLSAQTKTADGTDRKRIYRACETCRRKKIRCDGLKPCKPCSRMSESCVFLDDSSKNTYSKKYVEGLEQRLRRMEELVAKNDAGQSSGGTGTAGHTAAAQSIASPGSANGKASSSAGRLSTTSRSGASTQSFQMSLVALGSDEACAGRLQTDESGQKRYIGPSAALGILCDAASLALGPSANNGLERSILPPSAELRILTGGHGVSLAFIVPSYPSVAGVSLPPRDLAEALLQTYFESIHPIFPILDERETKHKCSLVYEPVESAGVPIPQMEQSSSSFSKTARADTADGLAARSDPLFLATLFAVFACASRVLKDPRVCTAWPSGTGADVAEGLAVPFHSRLREQDVWQHQFDASTTPRGETSGPVNGPNFALAGLSFFERAQVLSLHRVSDTRLEQVQCTALLALYMSACNCAARAWILCGTALRVAIDIGIHRAIMPLDLSVAEIQLQRRVWFCVYAMDRLLGIALGRPLGIEDINTDQFPASLSLETNPQKLMPGFNLLIDLLRLQALLCQCVTRLNNARSQSDLAAVENLRSQALDFETELAAWLSRVPAHLKNGMSEAGSPWDIQSVVLMATYYSAEMLLHRSLLQDSQKKGIATLTRQDDEILEKATRTALKIIKLAPKVSVLAATHYTLEYSQQVLVAASFLGLNAYRHRGSNALMLFTQADEGVLGLRLLESSFPGARNLRKALSRVLRALRQKCGITLPESPDDHAETSRKRGSSVVSNSDQDDAEADSTEAARYEAGAFKRSSYDDPIRDASSASKHMLSTSQADHFDPHSHSSRSQPVALSSVGPSAQRLSFQQPTSEVQDFTGLSFSVFSGGGASEDTSTEHQVNPSTTWSGGLSASAQGAFEGSASSTTNASKSVAHSHTAQTTDYVDTTTLATDFHFDGGFDPFAALELFSDLSAFLQGHPENTTQPDLSTAPSSAAHRLHD
ncbi:hypothetical protein V8E36_007798 [Tilletia maclaganii]